MLEKLRHITNPLTTIAVFAGLAEVAGTVVLATIDPSVQQTFVWFVMFFPLILVLLFFLTLNFNPRVLYAPSDFKDDANYLTALEGKTRFDEQLDLALKQLESSQTVILAKLSEMPLGESAVASEIKTQLTAIRERLEITRDTADDLAIQSALALTETEAAILDYLKTRDQAVTLTRITEALQITRNQAIRHLSRLFSRGLVVRTGRGRSVGYSFMSAAFSRGEVTEVDDA